MFENMCDVNENCVNNGFNCYPFVTHKPIDTCIDGTNTDANDYYSHHYNRQDIYRLVTTSTAPPPPPQHHRNGDHPIDPMETSPDNSCRRRPKPAVYNMNQMPGSGRTPLTPESPSVDPKKPVYVYYPNYSLPDLSFLQQILEDHSESGQQKVYLSPTSHQRPDRDSVSVKMRQKSSSNGSKRRLKSLNDFESFCKQNLQHIKDWDSLNILLPNEFKELIQKANDVSNSTINEMSCDSHISEDSLESDTTPSNSVRMRSHRSRSRNNNSNTNKRLSLQDYQYSRLSGQQSACNTMSAGNETSFMHRSVTMPNCHNSYARRQHCCHNSCNCHQHCCHNSCHCRQSCCHNYCHLSHTCGDRTPRHSPDKSSNKTSSDDMKSSSIDKLCHILATDLSLDLSSFDMDLSLDMDLTYDMDINGHNGWSNGMNAEKNVQRMTQNSNNLVTNENRRNAAKELAQKGSPDGSNFKELKQRWESMATVSPKETKSLTNSPNNGLNRKVNNINNNINKMNAKEVSKKTSKSGVKPETPRKPDVVLRRPKTSSIPRPTSLNTENPKRSQRKSMIPVPTGGQTKSPVYAKVKSGAGFKP